MRPCGREGVAEGLSAARDSPFTYSRQSFGAACLAWSFGLRFLLSIPGRAVKSRRMAVPPAGLSVPGKSARSRKRIKEALSLSLSLSLSSLFPPSLPPSLSHPRSRSFTRTRLMFSGALPGRRQGWSSGPSLPLVSSSSSSSSRQFSARRCVHRPAGEGLSRVKPSGYPVPVSASIGITLAPDDDTPFAGLFRKADAALYHSKRLGKQRFSFYGEVCGPDFDKAGTLS